MTKNILDNEKYEIHYSRINKNGKCVDDGIDNNFFKGYSKDEAEQKAKTLNNGMICNIRIVKASY